MPSVSAVKAIAANASSSVEAASSIRPASYSADSCGPDARVVEPRGCRDRLHDLAVAVLEHHRPGAVEDPGRPSGEGRRVPAGRDAVARRLGDREPNRRLADEPLSSPIAFEPPPTQATARSGSRPSARSSWTAASSPIRRWRSRTIVGYGCGPIAEPST